MADYRDRRSDDRDIKELFEAKLDVLDARYKNIGLQNDKLEAKVDKYLELNDTRLRQLETSLHGQGNRKGLLVRIEEAEEGVKEVRGRFFMSSAGENGLFEDVKELKVARKKRDHYWALMGGLASGFAIWLLGKFGTTGWEILAEKWKNAPEVKMATPIKRKRIVHIRYRTVPATEQEPDTQTDGQ